MRLNLPGTNWLNSLPDKSFDGSCQTRAHMPYAPRRKSPSGVPLGIPYYCILDTAHHLDMTQRYIVDAGVGLCDHTVCCIRTPPIRLAPALVVKDEQRATIDSSYPVGIHFEFTAKNLAKEYV